MTDPVEWPTTSGSPGAHDLALFTSPSAARVLYGRRALVSLAKKAATWPWRTEGGTWASIVGMVASSVFGIAVDPLFFLGAPIIAAPFFVQGLLHLDTKIRDSFNRALDAEIRELARRDGIIIDSEGEGQ
jgi:hypothetical protein